jgi:hypothetical protein
MNFKPEMINAIIAGRKTQTRRLVHPDDFAIHFILPDYDTGETTISSVQRGERLKWAFGRDYAVCLGRGKPGVWVKPDGTVAPSVIETMWSLQPEGFQEPIRVNKTGMYKHQGYTPLRIRIIAIRQEHLQDISADDLIAEGMEVNATEFDDPCDVLDEIQNATIEYEKLWDRLNTRKGTRFNDNPLVWVLAFEVVK